MNKNQIDRSWLSYIGAEFDRPYMAHLKTFLESERANGNAVYPREDHVFNALNHTKFDDVRVVILGQDPYHGEGQAHGLSFSVPDGVKIPPSLRNMYKELERDFGVTPPAHGNLTRWAEQGVLLLNATLTVQADKAGSHQNKGWEDFTDAVIRAVNDGRDHVAFLLWGSYAQKKGAFIDRSRHLVLTAPHPSPLSAHRGFIGCGHFRAANDYLAEQGRAVVQWI